MSLDLTVAANTDLGHSGVKIPSRDHEGSSRRYILSLTSPEAVLFAVHLHGIQLIATRGPKDRALAIDLPKTLGNYTRVDPSLNHIFLSFKIGSNTSSDLGWLSPREPGDWSTRHERIKNPRRSQWLVKAAEYLRTKTAVQKLLSTPPRTTAPHQRPHMRHPRLVRPAGKENTPSETTATDKGKRPADDNTPEFDRRDKQAKSLQGAGSSSGSRTQLNPPPPEDGEEHNNEIQKETVEQTTAQLPKLDEKQLQLVQLLSKMTPEQLAIIEERPEAVQQALEAAKQKNIDPQSQQETPAEKNEETEEVNAMQE